MEAWRLAECPSCITHDISITTAHLLDSQRPTINESDVILARDRSLRRWRSYFRNIKPLISATGYRDGERSEFNLGARTLTVPTMGTQHEVKGKRDRHFQA